MTTEYCDNCGTIETNEHNVDCVHNAEVQHIYWCIIEADGWYHVDGHYYADLNDSERQRMLFAQRIVRDQVRLDAWHAKQLTQPLNILVA